MRAFRAATRSPSTAKRSPAEVTCAIESRAADRAAARGGLRDPGGWHHDRRHRTAHERRAGRKQSRGLPAPDRLYFYDSISPIVDADTVDTSIAFRASRYGKSLDGTDDYLNCPLDRDQYERFVDALLAAEAVESHIPDDTPFFEACLPIEEMARRGRDTLRFGPMKPMGLIDPRTGQRPYAVVQLRQENLRARKLQPGGFSESLEIRRAGAHPANDSGPRTRRVPAFRADPSQHLHQRARARLPRRCNCAPGLRFFSPARFRASKVTWNPSPRA